MTPYNKGDLKPQKFLDSITHSRFSAKRKRIAYIIRSFCLNIYDIISYDTKFSQFNNKGSPLFRANSSYELFLVKAKRIYIRKYQQTNERHVLDSVLKVVFVLVILMLLIPSYVIFKQSG